jgi:uncharacterized membrane protein YcaP (DUF421 family)
MLHDLFHLGISPGEKALRTVAVYIGILVLLHLAGKRQLAQLNSFDLVVLLLLSNVVQNAIIGDDISLTGGLLGAAILVAGNYLVVRFVILHPKLRFLQGTPTIVVDHGDLDHEALKRESLTENELDAALRRLGVDDGIEGVDRAVLEPEGTLTPYKKPEPTLGDVLTKLEEIERRLALK